MRPGGDIPAGRPSELHTRSGRLSEDLRSSRRGKPKPHTTKRFPILYCMYTQGFESEWITAIVLTCRNDGGDRHQEEHGGGEGDVALQPTHFLPWPKSSAAR